MRLLVVDHVGTPEGTEDGCHDNTVRHRPGGEKGLTGLDLGGELDGLLVARIAVSALRFRPDATDPEMRLDASRPEFGR